MELLCQRLQTRSQRANARISSCRKTRTARCVGNVLNYTQAKVLIQLLVETDIEFQGEHAATTVVGERTGSLLLPPSPLGTLSPRTNPFCPGTGVPGLVPCPTRTMTSPSLASPSSPSPSDEALELPADGSSPRLWPRDEGARGVREGFWACCETCRFCKAVCRRDVDVVVIAPLIWSLCRARYVPYTVCTKNETKGSSEWR